MKIVFLRSIVTVASFLAAAFLIVVAFHYGQDFHEWFVETMGWESRDLGSYALAFLLVLTGIIGGFYLFAATILVPLDLIKDPATEEPKEGAR